MNPELLDTFFALVSEVQRLQEVEWAALMYVQSAVDGAPAPALDRDFKRLRDTLGRKTQPESRPVCVELVREQIAGVKP